MVNAMPWRERERERGGGVTVYSGLYLYRKAPPSRGWYRKGYGNLLFRYLRKGGLSKYLKQFKTVNSSKYLVHYFVCATGYHFLWNLYGSITFSKNVMVWTFGSCTPPPPPPQPTNNISIAHLDTA